MDLQYEPSTDYGLFQYKQDAYRACDDDSEIPLKWQRVSASMSRANSRYGGTYYIEKRRVHLVYRPKRKK